MMYRVHCIERVIVDDGGCGVGTIVYCLQRLLLTFIACEDDDRSDVQSIEGGRHHVERTGDH